MTCLHPRDGSRTSQTSDLTDACQGSVNRNPLHLTGLDFFDASVDFAFPGGLDLRRDPSMTHEQDAVNKVGHYIRGQLASFLYDFFQFYRHGRKRTLLIPVKTTTKIRLWAPRFCSFFICVYSCQFVVTSYTREPQVAPAGASCGINHE
jgi:hypothetical protein